METRSAKEERAVIDNGGHAADLSTFFIMEHRNLYALVLNEMIRNVRKEWGELSGTEYRCNTFIGQYYVSVGDRIQFRKNDRELGVTNGLLGTLIETKEGYFVIKTDEGREVGFNPQTFNHFQLGYAGTCHQSQGKTVKHTYALHSPYMNYNLLYVALTLQKESVQFIVSRDEAKDLETLIQQLSRDGSKETTVKYLTAKELVRNEEKASVLTKVFNYVKDKLHENASFYRIPTQVVVNARENDETFRGYAVKALSPIETTLAIRGEAPVQATNTPAEVSKSQQRQIKVNVTDISPKHVQEKSSAKSYRDEVDM